MTYKQAVDLFEKKPRRHGQKFSDLMVDIIGEDDASYPVWDAIAKRAFDSMSAHSAGAWMDSFKSKKKLVAALRKRIGW